MLARKRRCRFPVGSSPTFTTVNESKELVVPSGFIYHDT